MNRSKRSILMNAFHPATEVDDPDFFAGRAREVAALTDSLHVVGACPIIFGPRGLGKTSLAVQIRYIAAGDDELLTSLGLQDRALDDDARYVTFLVTCTDEAYKTGYVIQLLINAIEEADLTAFEGKAKASRLVERTTSRKISLKAFEAETTKRYEREKERLSYRKLSRVEAVIQLTNLIAETYNHPVLFIVDELDRVRYTKGLASFIKAASGENCKFVLVGIAQNVGRLIGDHQSLERSLVPINVSVMTEVELYEIVEKAETFLKDQGIDIGFDHFAILKMVELAAGYPWFIHVIGQSALLLVADEKRKLVTEPDVARAVQEITNNRFAQQFADAYRNAVRNSAQRETVLRTFAEWRDTDIPTSEVYRKLKTQLGVSNPSVYRKQLSSKEYGLLINTPQFQNRAYVRFPNEMFKIYVRLRASIYENVDQQVWQATRDRPW
jgi:hypothetical protein